jgi:hypothetical protein
MPQIRLTLKTIKELKTPLLHDISRSCEFFDDWYFDILLVHRRKVYLFMHLETKVAFAMPSFEIGGIKGIFQCLAILLQDFFFKYGNTRLAEKVYHSFNEDKPYFMKNTNKSMVPYSTQFKWRILHKVSMGFDLNQNLCDVISEKWLNIPMKNAQYTSPLSLMDNLIIQNNYITLN